MRRQGRGSLYKTDKQMRVVPPPGLLPKLASSEYAAVFGLQRNQKAVDALPTA